MEAPSNDCVHFRPSYTTVPTEPAYRRQVTNCSSNLQGTKPNEEFISNSGTRNYLCLRPAFAHDRRQYTRLPQIVHTHVRILPAINAGKSLVSPVPARIQNVSKGGVCIHTSEPAGDSHLLRCGFPITEEIEVATILKVCWSRKQTIPTESYLTGLSFIL